MKNKEVLVLMQKDRHPLKKIKNKKENKKYRIT